MAEWINRDKVLSMSYCTNKPTWDNPHLDPKGVVDVEDIESLPAADVVEVVHGRWVEEEFESYIPVEVDITGNLVVHKHTIYKCNICGRTEHQKELYCHCGAKMDK